MDSPGKDTGVFLTAILNETNYGIIAFDLHGTITVFNAGAEQMLGYTSKELTGQRSILYLYNEAEIAQRAQQLFPGINDKNLQAVIANAAPDTYGEWTWHRKDRSALAVQVSISSVNDHSGALTGYAAIVQDITRRKNHEATLLKYKNDLEELERISKVGHWEFDLADKRVYWSKEVYHIHEKPYDFVPDHETAIDFYDQDSIDTIRNAVANCIEHGTPYDLQLSIISASGNRKQVRSKGEAVYSQGRIVKLMGIFQDITREQEDQELLKGYALDLEKKNSELDQFAYVVSHDLKAPLRGIHNLSTWIEEDLGNLLSGDTAKNFDLLRKRVTRMENLINGILAYSRAGKSKSQAVYLNSFELVQEIVAALNTGKNTAVNIIQPMPFVWAEKVKLEQVFSNLISNAIKYNNSARPAITIAARENETEYTFSVADNGPGIDPAYHEKIFVIFQTLQSKDSFENTGVGLAIVKKIVEENGGTVWVDSLPQKGAKFYFTWLK